MTMDIESQLLGHDLLIIARQVLAEATEEDNGKKLHVGEVLAILATAIQEDEVESLAQTVAWWGRETLANSKQELPN
jgi:hypothetical protein